jgi:GMP synthase (glutamine-hydrolysing)
MQDVKGGILVVDFGGQYAHLIRRRVQDIGVKCELKGFDLELSEIKEKAVKGVILSGGPSSVSWKSKARLNFDLRKFEVPVLGICYGHQYIAKEMGGDVATGKSHEYGSSNVFIIERHPIFSNLPKQFRGWFSHGDSVILVPKGFRRIARSENDESTAIANDELKMYSVQFHPEVSHTEYGTEIIRNFVIKICGCHKNYSKDDIIPQIISEIREKVGGSHALCAVSGGVDSTTAAVITRTAIGDRLTCLFVNHGLLRKDEENTVLSVLRDKLKLNVEYVDATRLFLDSLRGVTDPEEKRLIIGRNFARIFEEFGNKHPEIEWLVQGTLYPDVVESTVPYPGAARIKSHHNVAGLPQKLGLKVIEPLRDMYKDEVRELAVKLGIPKRLVYMQPFPGPGLAVRIIREVTKEKLYVCREASEIFEQELRRSGIQRRLWQAFAFVGDDRAVGVTGDNRRYGYIVTLRAVKSKDGMTASFATLPWSLLDRVSRKITNTIPEVTMVCYSISNKPPSTIEPQ